MRRRMALGQGPGHRGGARLAGLVPPWRCRPEREDLLDGVIIIRVLLGKAEPAFDCDDALDVTDDGRVDVIDSIRLLQFLLERGSDLPEPFPGCGPDPTTESRDLACRESGCDG